MTHICYIAKGWGGLYYAKALSDCKKWEVVRLIKSKEQLTKFLEDAKGAFERKGVK